MKRRQEEERGMRINPEIFGIEGAEDFTQVCRQHPTFQQPRRRSHPGAWAHIETSRRVTEQERPKGNRSGTCPGDETQGRTEASRCERLLGVGFSHSSEEAAKANSRAVGAKGRTEQGTGRRER